MRIPPSLLFGLGRFLLFILLEATCIYMVANNGIVQRYKLIGGLREVQGYFWERYAAVNEYSNLKNINRQLADENRLLISELQKLKEINTSTANIDTNSYPFSFITAKVVKNSVGTTHNYLVLNKGLKDGIEENMGVVTPTGVIGITHAVSENFTSVLSFLNTNQQVSAKIGKVGAFGPLTWNPVKEGMAVLRDIPQHLEIKHNDTIYTSGFSSFYPPDIPIGTVEDFKVVNGVHLNIDVKLLQEFREINYVMVVKNNNREEIDSLLKGKGDEQ